jgi:hypothetical protein
MDNILFNQRTKELTLANTPEAEALFTQQEQARIFALTEAEEEAELAFLEQKFLEIKAEAKAYLAQKRATISV